MQVTDKLIRPLTETKYLSVENADRYRCIMRIFFENYEKLKYWMYEEEVYQEMVQDPYFSEYRQEQCQQDLTALLDWKNLSAIQDTRKVASIEEFKNRKYRYKLSEYSVEIERLVLRLENLLVEGASLEPTLLERIRRSLERFPMMANLDMNEVYSWWDDLNHDFTRLNQNYQDYIRDLNSVKAEEMMRTREFLVFKDKLVEYLHNFIKGLQKNVGVIEELLQTLEPRLLELVFDKITAYELSVPRITMEVSEEMIAEKTRGRFQNIRSWFVSENGQENEAGKLFDATNDIIRRITRYASQLSEQNSLGVNRREEYRKAAELFLQCTDMEQAHRMSAMVFGIEQPFHLCGIRPRESESNNLSVFEESAEEVILKPRIRTYRERSNRTPIEDAAKKKAEARAQAIRQLEEDQRKLAGLEADGVIDFSALPVLEPRVREILLRWLSAALEDPGFAAKTEDGRSFALELGKQGETCVVHCLDGNFTMPKMKIVFQ